MMASCRRFWREPRVLGYLTVAGETPLTAVLLVLFSTVAFAQSPAPGGMPPPPGMSLAASAAMRFPQPVRAGDLLNRQVLKPVESHDYLGRVKQVVRSKSGVLEVVIAYGGLLGFGSRQIAIGRFSGRCHGLGGKVGQIMEVVAYTPKQLADFPTFSASDATPLPDDAIIKGSFYIAWRNWSGQTIPLVRWSKYARLSGLTGGSHAAACLNGLQRNLINRDVFERRAQAPLARRCQNRTFQNRAFQVYRDQTTRMPCRTFCRRSVRRRNPRSIRLLIRECRPPPTIT